MFGNNYTPSKATAKVISVDKSKMTCTCKPVEGATMQNVLLTARQHDADFVGSVNVPKVDSMVVIDEVPHGFAVVETEELSEILIVGKGFKWLFNIENGEVVMNDGNNGGVIITPKLVSQLNKINLFIDIFKSVLATPTPEAGNGAPSSFQAALNTAYSTFQNPDYQGITNDKFKH